MREKLLTLPGKLADGLAHQSRDEVEGLLREEIYEALAALSDPQNFGETIGER